MGNTERHDEGDLGCGPETLLGQAIVHEERRLTRCRGTLERSRGDADDDTPSLERRKYVSRANAPATV